MGCWRTNLIVPVEQIRMPIPCSAGNRTEATHCKGQVNREEKERNSNSPSVRMARPVAGIMYVIIRWTALQ